MGLSRVCMAAGWAQLFTGWSEPGVTGCRVGSGCPTSRCNAAACSPSGSKFVTCSIRSATEVARASLPLLLKLKRGSVRILTLRLALLLMTCEGLLGPSSPRARFLSCSSTIHLSMWAGAHCHRWSRAHHTEACLLCSSGVACPDRHTAD